MSWSSLRSGTIATAVASVGILLTVGTAVLFGYELALLVLSTSVLVLVIVLFWSSVRNLAGDTPLSLDEALSMGAPTAAEEQKRAVLRALKDLDFERSVGKISEQDYLEFSARYRAEARKLITAADESSAPAHDLAQKLVAERLSSVGLAPAGSKNEPVSAAKDAAAEAQDDEAEADDDVGSEEQAAPSSERAPSSRERKPELEAEDHPSAGPAEPLANGSERPLAADGVEGRSCPECRTKNDLDARFCKSCGLALGSARPEPASSDEPAEEKTS